MGCINKDNTASWGVRVNERKDKAQDRYNPVSKLTSAGLQYKPRSFITVMTIQAIKQLHFIVRDSKGSRCKPCFDHSKYIETVCMTTYPKSNMLHMSHARDRGFSRNYATVVVTKQRGHFSAVLLSAIYDFRESTRASRCKVTGLCYDYIEDVYVIQHIKPDDRLQSTGLNPSSQTVQCHTSV